MFDNHQMLYYVCCGPIEKSHKIWGYPVAIRKPGGDRAACQSALEALYGVFQYHR